VYLIFFFDKKIFLSAEQIFPNPPSGKIYADEKIYFLEQIFPRGHQEKFVHKGKKIFFKEKEKALFLKHKKRVILPNCKDNFLISNFYSP